jgi:hypothetical protein
MTRDGDRPMVGATARTLGVRITKDISVQADRVRPRTGGMSVSPSWRKLPQHRIPRRLLHLVPEASGKDDDACWRMGEGPFETGTVADGLILRLDTPRHGLVEPVETMPAEDYQAKLAATRDLWRIDEG